MRISARLGYVACLATAKQCFEELRSQAGVWDEDKISSINWIVSFPEVGVWLRRRAPCEFARRVLLATQCGLLLAIVLHTGVLARTRGLRLGRGRLVGAGSRNFRLGRKLA